MVKAGSSRLFVLSGVIEAGKSRFSGLAETVEAVSPRSCEAAGLFYDGPEMTDMVDEREDSLPPATLTPTYYDRLAAEIMDDLEKVAAKFPKLEDRHRATANARRAHLNVPRPFLGTAVAVTEEIPEVEESGKLDPADGRETLQYLDAFHAVDDKLGAVRSQLRVEMASRRTTLAVQALNVYSLVRSFARDGRMPRYAVHVANLQRDLGKRGRPRKKRSNEDPPEPGSI